MCIAHYIARVIVEEKKKTENPDPTNYTCKVQTNKHKISMTLRCPALRAGTVNQLSPHPSVLLTQVNTTASRLRKNTHTLYTSRHEKPQNLEEIVIVNSVQIQCSPPRIWKMYFLTLCV